MHRVCVKIHGSKDSHTYENLKQTTNLRTKQQPWKYDHQQVDTVGNKFKSS